MLVDGIAICKNKKGAGCGVVQTAENSSVRYNLKGEPCGFLGLCFRCDTKRSREALWDGMTWQEVEKLQTKHKKYVRDIDSYMIKRGKREL